jgi:hypothetical protein
MSLQHLSFRTLCDKTTNISPRRSNAVEDVLVIFCQCHHMSLMDFVVSPPGRGPSVTDVWGWDAREAQLRCHDEADGDI